MRKFLNPLVLKESEHEIGNNIEKLGIISSPQLSNPSDHAAGLNVKLHTNLVPRIIRSTIDPSKRLSEAIKNAMKRVRESGFITANTAAYKCVSLIINRDVIFRILLSSESRTREHHVSILHRVPKARNLSSYIQYNILHEHGILRRR